MIEGSREQVPSRNNWVFYALLLAAYLPYLAIFWFLTMNPSIFSQDEARGLFGYALLGILGMSWVLYTYSVQITPISTFYEKLAKRTPGSLALIVLMLGIVGVIAVYFSWPFSVMLGRNSASLILFCAVLIVSVWTYCRVRNAVKKNISREFNPQNNQTS